MKPRIVSAGLLLMTSGKRAWKCYALGTTTGYGLTPKMAYQDWCRFL